MKIVFMGSPQFAIPTLKMMVANCYTPLAVYTSPPSKSGRGMKMRNTPVHDYAISVGIDVFTPCSLKGDAEFERLKQLNPDLIIVVAYGLMLPDSFLSFSKFGCLNLHPSLLPKWRGASPIQSAIMNGDDITGVTVIRLNNKLDAGPILTKKTINISKSDNLPILHDKLAVVGGEAMVELLVQLSCSDVKAIEQNDNEATYCGKITNYEIDWSKDSDVILWRIKGLFPRAFFVHDDGFRIRVLEADVLESGNGEAEISNGSAIVAGDGKVILLKVVQKEGSRACLISDFLRGLQKK